MAEKHKSKYKAPKDLEKSQKLNTRKDLKDYTEDDKKGALNPKSTGEKQLNVLRKTDKEFVDTGDVYVKYNADDRLYKDLEDGEYDPKHAAKVLKKRQDTDEKDNAKNIKDKIENLTREQTEKLVREYIRRKIVKILSEQPEKDAPEDEAAPTDNPAPEAPETPAADPAAPEAEAPAPAPEAPAAETPATPAPPAEAPAAPAAPQQDAETQDMVSVQKFIDHLQNTGGNVSKVKILSNVFHKLTKKAVPEDAYNFYLLIKKLATKQLSAIDLTKTKDSNN